MMAFEKTISARGWPTHRSCYLSLQVQKLIHFFCIKLKIAIPTVNKNAPQLRGVLLAM